MQKSYVKSTSFHDDYELPWVPEELPSKPKEDKWMTWNPPKDTKPSPLKEDSKKVEEEEEENFMPKFEGMRVSGGYEPNSQF